MQKDRIYEYLSYFNECNTDFMSNTKISDINMKLSYDKNFICSYYLSYCNGLLGVSDEVRYIEIDKEGNKIDLLEVYRSENKIVEIMQKMDDLEL